MSMICIVTGASRGIGFETCQHLAEEGHRVIAVARSQKPLEKLQQLHPSKIEAIPTDLTNEQEVQQFVASISANYKGVD